MQILAINIQEILEEIEDLKEVPTTVMLNPTWRKLSEETESEFEGCLSVPSIRGKVERYTNRYKS